MKPENVLIHERAFREGFATEGVVKVTDFGLGRAASNTAGSIAYSQSLDSPQGGRSPARWTTWPPSSAAARRPIRERTSIPAASCFTRC